MQNQRLAQIAVVLGVLTVGVAVGFGVARWRGAAPPADMQSAAPTEKFAEKTAEKSATRTTGERKVLYWYDPMVPTQRFDKGGKSPFMDMQLVPRYADEGGAGAGAATGLAVSAQAQQALGLRLATIELRRIGATVEAVGTLQLNERDVSIVQARSAGFVERVYARAPGDVIAAGAPLADVLTPEWLGAQQEYLAVKAVGDAALVRAARQRLLLLGMPIALVDRVDATGQPVPLQTITAPSGGVITELVVRAGMTVTPGMTLARINGLATVWLEAALPEALAVPIQPGQAVEARFLALPGVVVKGRVSAVLQEANRDTRTLRVRIELPNPAQRLRAGLSAQVTLRGPQREALVVPAEALIRTGKRTLVYLAQDGGRFQPVEVEVGEQVDELTVIRSGLVAGQRVVVSGQFLIDSEASLQGVMARAASAPAPATASATTAKEYRSTGVVVEFDADSLTLNHEPVPALQWPAMTMPFKVADKKLLQGLQKGQTLDFGFTKQGDDYVLKNAAPAKAGSPR